MKPHQKQEAKKMLSKYLWAIIPVVIFVLLVMNINSCRKINDMEERIVAVRDTNKMYRNQNNQLVSEKLAIVGTFGDLKNELAFMASKGDTLESKLSKATTSIVLLSKHISAAGQVVPKIYNNDTTIYINDTKVERATFSVDTADKYHHLKLAGNNGRIIYDVGFVDETELLTEDLGRKGTKVTVLNKNPHVDKSEATSIIVEPKKKRFWSTLKDIGTGIIIGAGAVAIVK